MIVIGFDHGFLKRIFRDVRLASIVYHPYAMPWRNHLPIFVCKDPYESLAESWPRWKHYE
jgi:hypothetical protein